MKEPLFELSFYCGNFWKNLKICLQIWALNCFTILATSLIAWLSLDHNQKLAIFNKFKNGSSHYNIYFGPFWDNIRFFVEYQFQTVILEEILYRGPVFLLLISGLRLKVIYNIESFVVVAAAIVLNIIWANNHPVFLPVFISGLLWIWLVMKTRALWPSIVCHFMCNFTLYLTVQLAVYFKLTS